VSPATPRFGWAGLLLGPGAWAIATELGYAMVPWACRQDLRLLPWLMAALATLALAGGLWSARALRAMPPREHRARFVTAIAAAIGLLFALVIALQGSAALFLAGCER